ncbi:MAG: flagellar basal body L-ring protein FlgH [Burkholderiales bacterium]|nr:flagellar basal body L-ring protein FlgH [Burkholderiales bacterium]
MKLLGILLLAGTLGACSVMPVEPLAHSKEFAPVYPVPPAQLPVATGSIYNGRTSESFFNGARSFQIGDLITVILDENTSASRNQTAALERKSSTDIAPPGLKNIMSDLGVPTNSSNTTNTGTGKAVQDGALSGSVTVAVVGIMSNGNLVLRGEKQLALTEGSEVVQVAGVIRPDDIAPNNTVLSRRLANAQITYRGTGDMAAVARPGWGTSLLLKLWPF